MISINKDNNSVIIKLEDKVVSYPTDTIYLQATEDGNSINVKLVGNNKTLFTILNDDLEEHKETAIETLKSLNLYGSTSTGGGGGSDKPITKGRFKGKFADDSTESDWYYQIYNKTTSATNVSIADKVDPITKEFDFESDTIHTYNTIVSSASVSFKLSNKIERIDSLPPVVVVSGIYQMFYNYSSLKSVDLSNWNVDLYFATSMFNMFNGCESLQTVNLSGWNIKNVTSITNIFSSCSLLQTADLSNWSIDKLTNVGGIFSGCESLQTANLSGWNTENVTNMNSLFFNCKSLQSIDLSGWDMTNVTSMINIFIDCDALTTIYARGCNQATIDKLNEVKPSQTVIVTD